MKNKITLYVSNTECTEKEKVELYDFSKMEHVFIDGRSYVRISCGKKFYHFPTQLTAISKVEIYEEK